MPVKVLFISNQSGTTKAIKELYSEDTNFNVTIVEDYAKAEGSITEATKNGEPFETLLDCVQNLKGKDWMREICAKYRVNYFPLNDL